MEEPSAAAPTPFFLVHELEGPPPRLTRYDTNQSQARAASCPALAANQDKADFLLPSVVIFFLLITKQRKKNLVRPRKVWRQHSKCLKQSRVVSHRHMTTWLLPKQKTLGVHGLISNRGTCTSGTRCTFPPRISISSAMSRTSGLVFHHHGTSVNGRVAPTPTTSSLPLPSMHLFVPLQTLQSMPETVRSHCSSTD